MPKDDAVRIADTITFIRTATVPLADMVKRSVVADILRDLNAAGRISDIISPVMSMGHNLAVTGRDQAKEYRHYRRAIILIRAALMGLDHNDAARAVGQFTDANLATELGAALDQVTSRLQDLTTQLALLKTDPVQFLQSQRFTMVGDKGSSGVRTYGFCYSAVDNLYKLAPEALVGPLVSIREQVYFLHVQQYASLAKRARANPPGESVAIDGFAAHGVDLMITTQLTGCSIVYYLNGANLVVAHVQPTGTDAVTMCTRLRADGVLSNAPGGAISGVFGAQAVKSAALPNNYLMGVYNNCVGVRSGGTWHLYAQQRAAGGAKESWQIA